MTRLRPFLDLTQVNAHGWIWNESLEGAEVYKDDVIRVLDSAIYREGALAVLRGNLAPDGYVVKPSATAPHLLRHSGPALVFDDYPALKASNDRDDLDVTENRALVLRNAGLLGGPGMPEWACCRCPRNW
jgi:dihydroxyacid dehydratase/phosphogluconate dehydratase